MQGFLLIISFTLVLVACPKSSANTTTTTTTTPPVSTTDISAVVRAKMVTGYVTVTTNGSNLVLSSDGRPNHKSPYWGVASAMYEPFPAGHASNPNGAIVAQTYIM